MKVNPKFTALIAAVVNFFPTFKAEDDIKQEHLEKVDEGITAQSNAISALKTEKENAVNALAASQEKYTALVAEKDVLQVAHDTLNTKNTELDAEVQRLCGLNPGATSAFKKETDTTTADDNKDDFSCSVDDEAKALRAKAGLYSKQG